MRRLPNLFNPERFNANLSRAENSDNDYEYSSPMLDRVLIFLDQDLSSGPKPANLLEKTMEPFGLEFYKPAAATVMAIILLSSYLLRYQPHGPTGAQFSRPSLNTPSIVLVQNLLGKSCWSSGHSKTLIKMIPN